MYDSERPRKVRDMVFTDLYLGDAVMGSRFSQVPRAPVNPVLAGPELEEDLRKLRTYCTQAAGNVAEENDFRIEYDGETYRVTVLNAVNGTVFVLRRMPGAIKTLQELGVPAMYARKLLQQGMTGLIIVSGAMSSGKTTTSGALVAERLVAYGGVAVTAEDPVELPLEGTHGPGVCYQTPAARSKGGFPAAIRNLLRSGANLLFLGEIRDGESAVEVLRAGINGHLVIATVHADDIPTCLRRLDVMASELFESRSSQALLADGVAMVLHQRLAGNPRRLEVELLSIRDSTTARATIRQGAFERLPSEISHQMTQMLNGRS